MFERKPQGNITCGFLFQTTCVDYSGLTLNQYGVASRSKRTIL
ncbi:MAG: hypothetical protein E6899_00945 [Neisseria sp.]|nr:hypothetical protein [Neisseria sp.]